MIEALGNHFEPNVVFNSKARKALKWDRVIAMSLNSDKARAFRDASSPADEELCTMCGEFCAVRKMTDVREGEDE